MTIPSISTIQGYHDGPTVTILGATHGDEPGGVSIIRQLLATLTSSDVCGTLHLGVGNPTAYRQCTRSADPDGSLNLNRVFTDAHLTHPAPTHPDVQRAQELAPLLATTDFLIDLHATSLPSEPFICFGRDPEAHDTLYKYAPVAHVVTDAKQILGGAHLGTTDAYVDAHGGVGICYETGQWSNEQQLRTALQGVTNMLYGIGSLVGDPHLYPKPTVSVISTSGCATGNTFVFDPHARENWAAVTAGQLIGTHENGVHEYASQTGRIIFQSRAAHIRPGCTMYYIATPY